MHDPRTPPAPKTPPDPDVYGGQWGSGEEPAPEDQGKPDRPDKIRSPNGEAPGAGELKE